MKQFAEFTIADGLKPSIEGVTIAKPIENSTLLRGLDRPSYLYISAVGSRKALVMNKKVMGRAGYFGCIRRLHVFITCRLNYLNCWKHSSGHWYQCVTI